MENTKQSKQKQIGKTSTQQNVVMCSRKSGGGQEFRNFYARPGFTHKQEVRAEIKETGIEMKYKDEKRENKSPASLKAAMDRKTCYERRNEKLRG